MTYQEPKGVLSAVAFYIVFWGLAVLFLIASIVVSVGAIFGGWPLALLWLWAGFVLFAALAVGTVLRGFIAAWKAEGF